MGCKCSSGVWGRAALGTREVDLDILKGIYIKLGKSPSFLILSLLPRALSVLLLYRFRITIDGILSNLMYTVFEGPVFPALYSIPSPTFLPFFLLSQTASYHTKLLTVIPSLNHTSTSSLRSHNHIIIRMERHHVLENRGCNRLA